MKFTDALDEYLEAQDVLNEAKKAYIGYEFHYHHYREYSRFDNAKDALNEFFPEKKEKL
jgi:hypothetical protein